jgi:hypothetical protein
MNGGDAAKYLLEWTYASILRSEGEEYLNISNFLLF